MAAFLALVAAMCFALAAAWLTSQHVVRRQFVGAGAVVIGLAMFVLVGDPDAGVDDASSRALVTAAVVISAMVALLMLWLRRKTSRSLRAAVLGLCAGLFFGLSATFAIPVIQDLHDGIANAAADWRTWALLGFGFLAFLIQQLSLATGQLAPAMAAVSVSNPAISVTLGILLFEERLTRPAWHVVVAGAASS